MILFKLFKPNFSLLLTICLTACLFINSNSLYAQDSSATKSQTVAPKDFGQWERINRGASFSDNGAWLQYSTITNDKDKALFIINTKSKKTQEIKNAERPQFSADNKWLVYAKTLPPLVAGDVLIR